MWHMSCLLILLCFRPANIGVVQKWRGNFESALLKDIFLSQYRHYWSVLEMHISAALLETLSFGSWESFLYNITRGKKRIFLSHEGELCLGFTMTCNFHEPSNQFQNLWFGTLSDLCTSPLVSLSLHPCNRYEYLTTFKLFKASYDITLTFMMWNLLL